MTGATRYRPLSDLMTQLEMQQLDQYLYFTDAQDEAFRLYGGQVVAQSLNAALRSLNENWYCHSLHAYFLLAGRSQLPVIYQVDPIRDGRSFATRHVTARQAGKVMFNCTLSFHKEEPGLDHQMPLATEPPPPEGLIDEGEHMRRLREKYGEKSHIYTLPPFDIRAVEWRDRVNPQPTSPNAGYWIRAKEPVSDNIIDHQSLLAYISDWNLLSCALRPHPYTAMNKNMMAASLDHALWFHRPFRVDEWLFYAQDTPSAHGGRGFSRGSFYTRDGVLVASAAQESLIRAVTADPR